MTNKTNKTTILPELVELIKIEKLGEAIVSYDKKLKRLKINADKMIAEGVLDFNMPNVKTVDKDSGKEVPNLDAIFGEANKRLEAARRALGLVNKLPQGESRTMHKRRIMGNLNRIRALVYDLQLKLGLEDHDA